jgi:MFS family permease
LRRRLSLLMFLQYAPQGAFVPLFSLRLQELGFSPVEIGGVCATQALAAFAALAAGQLADRWFPAQRCLAVCALLAGTLLWILAGLTGFASVLTASLVLWLMLGPVNTLGTSLTFAHLPAPERDFGRVRLWGTVGWVAAGWLVGAWLSRPAWLFGGVAGSGLADAFRVAGLLALALAGYALTLPHTPPQRRGGAGLAPLAALRLLRQRDLAVYWACAFGVWVTLAFTTQVAPLLLEHEGIPRAWVGPTLTLSQSMEIASLAVLPVLLLRLGIRGTMLLGLGAWAVLLGVLTLGEPLWLVVSSLSLNGLCICCFLVAGQVFVNRRARGDIRVSAQAVLTLGNGLGLLTGNLLVGWVRRQVDQQFAPTFAVGAGLAVLLVVVFFLGFRGGEPAAAQAQGGPVGRDGEERLAG